MKAGPKAAVDPTPLPWRSRKSGGARVVAFCERFLTVPKGTGARSRFRLRAFQRDIVHGLFDPPCPRQGLVSIPRGNGKSTLAAALALYALFADGVEGPQVLCVASDERQARIVFNIARRMVELEPLLAARCQVFQDHLYVPGSDGVLTALPSEAGALQGWDPSLCIVDELHVVDERVWEAMSLASGKRDRSLVLAISTPAANDESIMWRLVEHGRAQDDPSFYFAEFAATSGCALDDEAEWYQANPALGVFLHIDALRATRRTSREGAFRRFRLGQWVQDTESWLPWGAWDACCDPRPIPAGLEVVVALDGSFSQDLTALVACSIEAVPHLDVVGLWTPPPGSPDYRVPVADVEEAIREACRRWQVREIVADPFRWTRSLQALEAEGLPVVEFPQSPARMTPATAGLYEAVVNAAATHSGNLALAQHVANAVVRTDARGTRLVKASKHSTRRIDLAVAAVMAHARASALARAPGVQVWV